MKCDVSTDCDWKSIMYPVLSGIAYDDAFLCKENCTWPQSTRGSHSTKNVNYNVTHGPDGLGTCRKFAVEQGSPVTEDFLRVYNISGFNLFYNLSREVIKPNLLSESWVSGFN